MAHIKRMVMQGFKSFAKKTEIDFDKDINVFVGPNGSGKSNVGDALCFVLGRLSIKSMRAAKAKNLIFMGSKFVKPSKEASVELVFDNSDKAFNIEGEEVNLKRIVRANGQGVYKINDEIKTRMEVVETLAQAGIDPHGFNLVMQGQIQGIVKMHPDERRKIIEEVAGISIYESRKEKSLKELGKTEERLKEISTILRERTAYLRNLEKEKAQAQKYKDSEMTVKKAKASILHKKREEKIKEIESVMNSIMEKDKMKDDERKKIDSINERLEELGKEIEKINKQVQNASGLEQEKLHENITNLKAELEGSKVRKESYENRLGEVERRIGELELGIPEMKKEIEELRKESPLVAKKAEELKKKKEELASAENERKRLHSIKHEIQSLKERIKDKERELARVDANSDSLLERIEDLEKGMNFRNEEECLKKIEELRSRLSEKKKEIEELNKNELENSKLISVNDSEIIRAKKTKEHIEKVDVCPLCQSKMTNKHVGHVHEDCDSRIEEANEMRSKVVGELEKIVVRKIDLEKNLLENEKMIGESEVELMKHKNIIDKKEELKKVIENDKILKEDLGTLDERRKILESKIKVLEGIEGRYDKMILDIEEISSRTIEDVDTTLLYKERELENTRNIIKRSKEDLEGIEGDIGEISVLIGEKEGALEELESKEEELQSRFKKMFASRDSLSVEIQEGNSSLYDLQSELRQVEDQVNYLKIGKAKLDAEKEALEMELSEFAGIELLTGSIQVLDERLQKAKSILSNIGAINMRALEVYDEVKKEYDVVYEKVETLEKEKGDIMKIIDEIDKKKRWSFMKTFKAINGLFSENFAKLSTKGVAYLEVENKEDLFEGGINIAVKLAKGKYFDVTSLSGGEQTLVALSLLFAIQEHKPYHFYVFDEIDAALDKRNSERLSGLLTQYMKSGQYIVITHNDAIITNSNTLYGVSMHEGISKILSMRVEEEVMKSVADPGVSGGSESGVGDAIVEEVGESREVNKVE
jgi:chromosome segregation protein